MKVVIFLCLIIHFYHVHGEIILCNQQNDTIEICALEPGYKKDSPLQTKILPIIELKSITKFDEEQGSITLDLNVKVVWNDTRLSLTQQDQ